MERKLPIKVGTKHYEIIDERGDNFVNIYIPKLTQLFQIDSLDKDIDYIGDIISDIENKRLELYEYKFLGFKYFDIKIRTGSAWSDYPKSQTPLKALVKKVGTAYKIGFIELDK